MAVSLVREMEGPQVKKGCSSSCCLYIACHIQIYYSVLRYLHKSLPVPDGVFNSPYPRLE